MQWFLHDGSRRVVLSTERSSPVVGSVLVDDPTTALAILHSLSAEPTNTQALREIHSELVDDHNVRDHADAIVLGDLEALVTSAQLYVFEQDQALELEYVFAEPEEVLEQDSERLVVAEESEPPAPEPEPEPSPAVAAQIDALVRASAVGAPFCED